VPRAVAVLKRIDLDALKKLERRAEEIDALSRAVRETLDRGRRVFLCGCGATGRLSMSLEFLWRRQHPGSESVVSFMAGGDVALVHALEGFEDHGAYGARHLEQLGFADGDLLIASTEGGETPFVIGATERAAQISSTPPYFLYCNDDSVLASGVERFRRVHENSRIRRLCLPVGPMALAGSTRLQASTVLQLAVGCALLHADEPAEERIADLHERILECDFSFLAGFIEKESAIYAAGQHVIYRVRDYGITVLTDTTERAPTFSLVPFGQLNGRPQPHSLCYVSMADAESAREAWLRLLGREPQALDWPEIDRRTTACYLHGFDFSARVPELRRRRIPDRRQREFEIRGAADAITFSLGRLNREISVHGMPELARHLLLKTLLNIHSTLVMGRLGRYQSNLMTWVTPTNGKLVDRAARYVQYLLDRSGRSGPAYDVIVHRLFAEMDRARPDESIVLRTFRALT
jgi:N-acetylmuramic acid 6-phosphate etherase